MTLIPSPVSAGYCEDMHGNATTIQQCKDKQAIALAVIFSPVWVPIAIVGGSGYLVFKGGKYVFKKAKKGTGKTKNSAKKLWVKAKCQTRCTKKRCLDNAEVLFNCVNKCPPSTIKNCITSDINKIVTLATEHIQVRRQAMYDSRFDITHFREVAKELDQKADLLGTLKELQALYKKPSPTK